MTDHIVLTIARDDEPAPALRIVFALEPGPQDTRRFRPNAAICRPLKVEMAQSTDEALAADLRSALGELLQYAARLITLTEGIAPSEVHPAPGSQPA